MWGSISVFLLLIVNFSISASNAWVVGRSWADVNAIGSGWQNVVLASTFIMSGCGFTWCYLVIFAMMSAGLYSGTVVREMEQHQLSPSQRADDPRA